LVEFNGLMDQPGSWCFQSQESDHISWIAWKIAQNGQGGGGFRGGEDEILKCLTY